MSDTLSQLDDVVIHAGDVTRYVAELIDNMGALEELREQLRFYIDHAGMAHDMHYNGTTCTVSGYWECVDMRLTAYEMRTLRKLLLAQLVHMREAERAGLSSKLATYQARIDVLDKVIDNELIEARDELVDESRRVSIRVQEGRY